MKAVFFLVAVVLPAVVLGHGGITSPSAYSPQCSSTSCGTTAPCGGQTRPSSATPVSLTTTSVTVGFHVSIAHANAGNTLKLMYHTSGSDSGAECADCSNSIVAVSDNTNINCACDFPVATSFSPSGFISAVFNTTAGGGDVYYTCAAVVNPALDTNTDCAAPEAADLSFCTWYASSTCCTGSTTGSFISESEANSQYSAMTLFCGFLSSCSQECKDQMKLAACQPCAPTKNNAEICKEFCQSIQKSCGGGLFSSVLALISTGGDCDSLPSAADGNCFNSATQIAGSAAIIALLALVAMLF